MQIMIFTNAKNVGKQNVTNKYTINCDNGCSFTDKFTIQECKQLVNKPCISCGGKRPLLYRSELYSLMIMDFFARIGVTEILTEEEAKQKAKDPLNIVIRIDSKKETRNVSLVE